MTVKESSLHRKLLYPLLVCILAAVFSCTPKPGGISRKDGTNVVLRIVVMVFDETWRVHKEIVVRSDDSFVQSGYPSIKSGSAPVIVEGNIPHSLTEIIDESKLELDGVELVDGVATYLYCIDDHRVQHPPVIVHLLGRIEKTRKASQ